MRDVEPWAALARFRGDGVDRRALVHAAWRSLLLCQPHDTLCGCSVDEVASAMSARLDEASPRPKNCVLLRSCHSLRHDGNDARRKPDEWSSVVVVRNAAPRARGGVAEIDVDLVLDDAPVGPASAGIEPRDSTNGTGVTRRSAGPAAGDRARAHVRPRGSVAALPVESPGRTTSGSRLGRRCSSTRPHHVACRGEASEGVRANDACFGRGTGDRRRSGLRIEATADRIEPHWIERRRYRRLDRDRSRGRARGPLHAFGDSPDAAPGEAGPVEGDGARPAPR